MAKKKKNTQENNDISSEEASRQFGVSLKDLKTLMQTRGIDGIRELNDIHGGLSGLGQKLKTNLIHGLPEDENDLATRITAFGRNEIPPKPPKTFFRLMFEALQDVTLVILIICAVISFGLSFYHPSGDTFHAEAKPSKISFFFVFLFKIKSFCFF